MMGAEPTHAWLQEHAVRPYSVSQLADRWDCSPSMIRKLIKSNRLRIAGIVARA